MMRGLFSVLVAVTLVVGACESEDDTVAGTGAAATTSGTGGAGGPLDGGIGGTGGAPPPPDASTIDGLTLHLEESTPEQIGLYVTIERALAAESVAHVRYRAATESAWHEAHPLLRINPAWVTDGAPEPPVDSFAGSIFDLTPGADYYVEITLEEPGEPARAIVAAASTRALPPDATAATVTATAADDLQAMFDSLAPGDVLELADGTYEVDGLQLTAAGTQGAPIVVRGASREGVVIHDASGTVIQLLEASHLVLENLTLQGSGVDSGTDASSVAVSFWDGASQEAVTFRGLDIRGVDMGIVAWGPTRAILVYDCDLEGNNVWNAAFVETNLTWNDDGIRLPGQGNCAFENTLYGFGDSLAVTNGVHSAAVHYYRNRIRMTGDDAFEADYGTRNFGYYDNLITNASTFLSLDPLWGGPLYCFRNLVVNTVRGPFKLNNTNAGFFIYNNTIVRTEGTTDWGWVQYNNGDLRAWSYRNNVLVYLGGSGNLLAIESGVNDPIDFSHNAWYPDGSVWWTSSGGSFGSFAEAQAGLPATTPLFGTDTARHASDVLIDAAPFASAIDLGADHLTEVVVTERPGLRSDVGAKNAGVAIANVTDGFTGSAPDMGAVIEGRALPQVGATRP